MSESTQRSAWILCFALAVVLVPAAADAQWRAPNVHTIFSGSTFGNGQSQNMGPALNHTLTEYCDRGTCDDDGDPDCDTLRLGLTMFPAVDGGRDECGWGEATSNIVVQAQEDGCYDVGGELKGMQNQAGREYCDQSGGGWQYEPLDEVMRLQREATFPEAYDDSDIDVGVLSRWWERANVNLVMLERMPQTNDVQPGGRVINSLREACRSYDGDGKTFPSMPTFVLGMKDNTADVSLYGGLLAAAGGTGKCCHAEGGCTLTEDNAIDICSHIEDGRDDAKIRQDIDNANYECGGSTKLTVTGAPETTTLPNLECALAAEKCNGAFAPEPPTDFFGIFACIQVRPQEVPAEEFAVRYCHDEELNCEILKEGEGLEYVDENKTLYYLQGTNQDGTSYCTALGDREATFEPWECPNEGEQCDTGRPGRCGVGKISCASGYEECVQTLAPMPEICNGLDDDCSGEVDNLSDSWDDARFSAFKPTELDDFDGDDVDRTGIHCYERNVCRCAGGDSLDYGGPGYEAHIMSWRPGVCECGEGLGDETSGGYTPVPSAESVPSADRRAEPGAGCSAVGSGAGPGALAGQLAALIFGLFVLLVCRRRSQARR